MKKFKFRLQSLENIKALEEDSLRQALAEAHARLLEAEHQLIELMDSLEQSYIELTEMRKTRTDPIFLLSLESYSGILRNRITSCRQAIAKKREELKTQQEALAEKHKEKKVLEKYRERQQEKHSLYNSRLLQEELDEAAINATGKEKH